jgi:leucyl aminopeptidase
MHCRFLSLPRALKPRPEGAFSMKLFSTIAVLLLATTGLVPAALADTIRTDRAEAATQNARQPEDPYAPLYIVSSADTFRHLKGLARNPSTQKDSVGKDLVVSEILAWQVSQVSELIHQRELRCGGFFAFSTRKEAEAFIAGDHASRALAAPLALAYTIDNHATVDPWLPQVSEANVRNTISQLSANQNRYYTSATGKSSAEWIRNTWQGLAGTRSDVSTELFTACSNCSTQPSAILTIQGNELASEIVVLGAHLDSINVSANGSNTQTAPGADDDGSGIATLTEVIRIAVASGWKPRRTVKFMGYAAEEVGLRGSAAIAQSFKSAGKNVVGVLQMDMTNYKSGNVSDMQLITDYSNTDLKAYFVSLFDAYLAPSGLTRSTYTCGYGCSDHASWTSAGYPSAMFFEAGDSSGYFPYIHSANDTLANMGNSAANSVKFVKFSLAFLGELAKTSGGGTPTNQPPVANFGYGSNGLTVNFTDNSSDSDGTIASRSWNFGDGGTSTATSPSHTYAADGTYSVTLTVTDNGGASNSKTQGVTVSGGTALILTNGVPVNGLSAATGASITYVMNVPAGASNLKFVSSGGTGDADMYVKFGSAPTDSSYDCRPYTSGNAETCTIATAQTGTYYVRLKAYASFSGVSLTGSYTTGGGGGGTVLTSGVPVTLPAVAAGAWSSDYTIDVPAGKTSVVFTTSGGTGDGDMYVRIGAAPTTSTYNCRPYTSGNAETCTFNSPTAGTYHVSVRAYAAYSGVSLKATISP